MQNIQGFRGLLVDDPKLTWESDVKGGGQSWNCYVFIVQNFKVLMFGWNTCFSTIYLIGLATYPRSHEGLQGTCKLQQKLALRVSGKWILHHNA